MLELITPTLEDLWFRESLMADEETMSYNHAWGGTIPFPKEDWADWYDYWIVNHENMRYYLQSHYSLNRASMRIIERKKR